MIGMAMLILGSTMSGTTHAAGKEGTYQFVGGGRSGYLGLVLDNPRGYRQGRGRVGEAVRTTQ